MLAPPPPPNMAPPPPPASAPPPPREDPIVARVDLEGLFLADDTGWHRPEWNHEGFGPDEGIWPHQLAVEVMPHERHVRPKGKPSYGRTRDGHYVELTNGRPASEEKHDPVVTVSGEGWPAWFPVQDGDFEKTTNPHVYPKSKGNSSVSMLDTL